MNTGVFLRNLQTLLLSALLVFAPLKSVILTACILILADFITGVFAASKRKEAITSTGFKRTVVKLFVYETVLCLAFLAEQYMTTDLVPVQKICAAFIGLTEFKSILENLNDLAGGSMLNALINKINHE
jgi:phage-related holin